MARSLLCGGRYGDDAAAAAALELDGAGACGVDRVVLADSHAVARVEPGAALADDDLAAGHGLSGEDLHAEALGVRVAPVAACTETLLFSHPRSPSSWCVASSHSDLPGPFALRAGLGF